MANRPGQALVEYVLIICVIFLTLVSVLTVFRVAVADGFTDRTETIDECLNPGKGGANPGRGGGTPRGQCLKGR